MAGDANVQSNLELGDHGNMTVGGKLTIGGRKGYYGKVMLLGASRLQAANMTLLGLTDPRLAASTATRTWPSWEPVRWSWAAAAGPPRAR